MFGFAMASPSAVEGMAFPAPIRDQVPLKPASSSWEYEDETYSLAPHPVARGAGRNGTYAVSASQPAYRLPPVPAPARQRPRRGGLAVRQDCPALAQWGAAGTGPGQGRS